MTLLELEKELEKAIAVSFGITDYTIILYFKDRKTSFEVYAEIGEYFDEQDISLILEKNEKGIRTSLVSKSTADTFKTKWIDYNSDNLNEFINNVDTGAALSFFTGYRPSPSIYWPNLVEEQNYRLKIRGYNII